MNYKGIHDHIIKSAIALRGHPRNYRDKRSGYHIHHVTPKCFGGGNESSNLAILTPREHFVIHWLLWKIHGGKMATAFRMMTGAKHTMAGRMTSKVYSKLCENANSASFSDKAWRDNHFRAINRKDTHPEWYKNTTAAAKKRATDPVWLKKNGDSIRKTSQTKEWKERQYLGALKSAKPVIGEGHDKKICLIGVRDMKEHGYSNKKISAVLNGAANKYKNMTWRFAELDEVKKMRPDHPWLTVIEEINNK